MEQTDTWHYGLPIQMHIFPLLFYCIDIILTRTCANARMMTIKNVQNSTYGDFLEIL